MQNLQKNAHFFFQILDHSEGADFLLRQRTHSPIGTYLPVMPGMSTRFKWAKHDIAKKGGTTCIFCSWQKSPYWHPGRRRHIIPIWNWVGGGSILPARVCPHLSSPDEGGARARANTKVHSKPAITWVLSLVCPPKCQAHYIEHRYTYIPKVYTTHIYGELCSKSCNFTAQFSSTNKCKCT